MPEVRSENASGCPAVYEICQKTPAVPQKDAGTRVNACLMQQMAWPIAKSTGATSRCVERLDAPPPSAVAAPNLSAHPSGRTSTRQISGDTLEQPSDMEMHDEQQLAHETLLFSTTRGALRSWGLMSR